MKSLSLVLTTILTLCQLSPSLQNEAICPPTKSYALAPLYYLNPNFFTTSTTEVTEYLRRNGFQQKSTLGFVATNRCDCNGNASLSPIYRFHENITDKYILSTNESPPNETTLEYNLDGIVFYASISLNENCGETVPLHSYWARTHYAYTTDKTNADAMLVGVDGGTYKGIVCHILISDELPVATTVPTTTQGPTATTVLTTTTVSETTQVSTTTVVASSPPPSCAVETGDPCTTRTGQPGICKKTSDCIQVENDIRNGITNDHIVCGYAGLMQIVCCPNEEPNRLNSISSKKCDEYNEFSFNKTYLILIFRPPKVNKVPNCAFTSMSLIVDGTEARPREFPHMALIGFEDTDNDIHWDCGGTLISEQFVLSAAHCSQSRRNGPATYVRLGEHDQNRVDDGTTIDLRIIERIPHPDFHYPILYNDIGLFKLERRIKLSGAIRPACLPQPQVSNIHSKTAVAAGWGKISWGGSQSDVLRKVGLDKFSQSECNHSYGRYNRSLPRGIMEETQICAGSRTGGKDTCQGDSGGPLQVYHKTHSCSYTVVGVTSFGKRCGTIGYPGVYTKVLAYLNWIEGIVWPNE